MESQHNLLDSLEIQIRDLMQIVRTQLANLDDVALHVHPEPGAWNVLECLAHLNGYSEHYTSLFEKAIHKAKAREWLTQEAYESTWMGRWAINSVNPESEKPKKMKAPKDQNYTGHDLSNTEIKRFLVNQELLLRILTSARAIDLNKAKIPMAVFPYTKLNLGNFLEFMVLHERRHILQALRCVHVTLEA